MAAIALLLALPLAVLNANGFAMELLAKKTHQEERILDDNNLKNKYLRGSS